MDHYKIENIKSGHTQVVSKETWDIIITKGLKLRFKATPIENMGARKTSFIPNEIRNMQNETLNENKTEDVSGK